MLSTLSSGSVGSTNDKRRRTNTDFNDNAPATESNSPVLQSFCSLIKAPSENANAQRYSSSDSEGLLVQYNQDDNKQKSENEPQHIKQLQDLCVETAENVYLPELCNQFEEMSKVSFQTHSTNAPHSTTILRDSKTPQEIILPGSSENIFDVNLDFDDFMFPQHSASISSISHPLPSNDIGLSYNSEEGTDHHGHQDFPSSHLVSTDTGYNGFSNNILRNGANYNPETDSSKGSSGNVHNLSNPRHCNYSSICNDAFIESSDHTRRLAMNIPRLGESYGNRDFAFDSESISSRQTINNNSSFHMFGKRENSVIASAIQPENELFSHNFSPNAFPNVYDQMNGSYFDGQAHGSLNQWKTNGVANICLSSNRDIDNDEVRCSSNVSSDSRTESHDTDVSGDATECKNEQSLPIQICQKFIPPENKNSSKKTAYNEKWGVKVFKAWCIDNHVSDEFEKLSAEELNELLTKFWHRIRKSNGDYYGRNSLFNLRAMINKHLKGEPYSVSFDIVTDDRFRLSNECLDEQLKHLKGLGRTIAHKVPISPSDIQLLYESKALSTSTPISLLRKVWFEVTLHFCPKGGESQEKIQKSTFKVFRDESGRRYVARAVMKHLEGGKTEARMYDTFGSLCPVKSFEFYLTKLHPMQPRLFQQPRKKTNASSPTWYGKSPIGEKALQQMMANISMEANLSKRYTNHCVRTTALQQFTDLRKSYEALEPPNPEHHPTGSKEAVHTSSTRQVEQLEEASHNQNDFRGLHGDLQTSLAINFYHPTNIQASTSTSCLNHYDQVGGTPLRRHSEFSSSTGNSVPLIDNPDINLTKRSYFSEVPLFPPPTYNDYRHQRLHTIPSKRVRTEEGVQFYQTRSVSPPHDQSDSLMHTSNPFVLQDPQHLSSYHSQSYLPQSNDEGCKGQNFAVLSPIQITPIHKKRARKSPQKKAAKLSETIVTGFPFELVEANLDFEKSCVESPAHA